MEIEDSSMLLKFADRQVSVWKIYEADEQSVVRY